MTDAQLGAVADPLRRLQAALDGDAYSADIGAAKDLVDAACKIALEHAGTTTVPRRADLPALFKLALPDGAARCSDIGRRLAATVQRLAEFRNIAGAGDGHASLQDASAAHVHLAASAASGLAGFILGDPPGQVTHDPGQPGLVNGRRRETCGRP